MLMKMLTKSRPDRSERRYLFFLVLARWCVGVVPAYRTAVPTVLLAAWSSFPGITEIPGCPDILGANFAVEICGEVVAPPHYFVIHLLFPLYLIIARLSMLSFVGLFQYLFAHSKIIIIGSNSTNKIIMRAPLSSLVQCALAPLDEQGGKNTRYTNCQTRRRRFLLCILLKNRPFLVR